MEIEDLWIAVDELDIVPACVRRRARPRPTARKRR